MPIAAPPGGGLVTSLPLGEPAHGYSTDWADSMECMGGMAM